MITRPPCPAATSMWFLGKVATPSVPDYAIDAPPWCTSTWEVVPDGYGSPLTAAQVIGAHVATHSAAERSGRMPSRAEVLMPSGIPTTIARSTHYER